MTNQARARLGIGPLLVAVVLVACGGKTLPSTESDQAGTADSGTRTGSGTASGSGSGGGSGGGSYPGSSSGSPPPPDAGDPNGGACSVAPVAGPIGSGDVCFVVVGLDSNDSIILQHGDSGSAVVNGSTLTLSCSLGGKVLMSATIPCYQGAGRYTVGAGALVLGGQTSDRPCSFDAYIDGGNINGFIGCSKYPADPSNLFAHEDPPVGLGSYALPLQ